MLLQTNSYIVPKDKRTEHGRLMQRFRQAMLRLGCEMFEVYEQTAANWAGAENAGRFVQMMRFRDRKHQQAVQAMEKSDPVAQQLIKEFCDLINFPYQQQQGYFATGYYTCIIGPPSVHSEMIPPAMPPDQPPAAEPEPAPLSETEQLDTQAALTDPESEVSSIEDPIDLDGIEIEPSEHEETAIELEALSDGTSDEPTPDDTHIDLSHVDADEDSTEASPSEDESSGGSKRVSNF